MIAPVPETNPEQLRSRRRWRQARRLVASTLLSLPSKFEPQPRRFFRTRRRRWAGILLATVAIGAMTAAVLLR